MNRIHTSLAIAGAMANTSALADITTTLGTSAPTYSTTLNFDEPGTPTGPLSASYWQTSHGVIIDAGDGNPQVDDYSTVPGQGWLGTDNSYFGFFGVFMTFDNDLTDFSAQVWDPSGAPGPFGGGALAVMFNDGSEVGSFSFTPSWGGVGDEWLNISATNGMVFDEIRIVSFGFDPLTYIDNASWNAIPAPGSLALLGLGCVAAGRRRRA